MLNHHVWKAVKAPQSCKVWETNAQVPNRHVLPKLLLEKKNSSFEYWGVLWRFPSPPMMKKRRTGPPEQVWEVLLIWWQDLKEWPVLDLPSRTLTSHLGEKEKHPQKCLASNMLVTRRVVIWRDMSHDVMSCDIIVTAWCTIPARWCPVVFEMWKKCNTNSDWQCIQISKCQARIDQPFEAGFYHFVGVLATSPIKQTLV